MKKLLLLFILPALNSVIFSQHYKIIESTSDHIRIEFNFENAYQLNEETKNGEKFNVINGDDLYSRLPGEPGLPNINLNIGIPFNSRPVLKILSLHNESRQNVFILPTPDSLNQPFNSLPYKKEIYAANSFFPQSPAAIDDFIMRYARVISLSISPYQFNPVTRELLFNKKLIVEVSFKTDSFNFTAVNKIFDKMTDDFLKSSVVNYNIAREFTGKSVKYQDSPASADTYWYNPAKDYYKIYLKDEGVFRITYDMLINAGVPLGGGIQKDRLELFNNGVSVPIDIVDANTDNIFNAGDYFQFVGKPPGPHDQYTRMNIYNRSNVYWFSYQADSPNNYRNINGFKNSGSPLINSTVATLRYEKDLIYQHFGLANSDQRDYWQWGYAEARNRTPFRDFVFLMGDSITQKRDQNKPDVKIRVGMHGLTNSSCIEGKGHSVTVRFNNKVLGIKEWNGQESAVFEKPFYLTTNTLQMGDTVQIFPDQQRFEINLSGNICTGAQTDFVFVNYIEFEYWRLNRTYPNHYFFTSPPDNFQENRYYLAGWKRNNMKIYIPERGEIITNPFISGDQYNSVYFIDTVSERTDYYCAADDYYQLPDSIVKDTPSDLRNISNGADYIIIVHKNFLPAAERLAQFRSNNLSGFTSPRVKIAEVSEIYDEFSYGLLSPGALREFVKYAFENWQQPAPLYIVLMGDMSHDYRGIFTSSRKNYIPSMPYHAYEFGQAPSDNLIVSVAGDDLSPDLAIGRLSCETPEEADILVDKIINYPADNSKGWKENVLLLSSGLSYQDQISLGFNNANKLLENSYIYPNGINAVKVFNYPEPVDSAFLGSGPEMRTEINDGAVLVNYYGHGGGGQWDLVFTNDDILELNNENRLPVILSITCYTAHFDDQTSFGEHFNRISGKGCIGFWGSSGLTFWFQGKTINEKLFKQLFNNKNYVIGNAILGAKAEVSGTVYEEMIAQLSYLGDPAVKIALPENPDFEIKPSDITIFPPNPLKDDTVVVSVNVKNLGVVFPGDSVVIELFRNTTETGNLIAEMKTGSFGHNESFTFQWIPGESGLFSLIVRVNEKDVIDEEDHSDNIASASFSVFDFGEPNIIKPVNGYFTDSDKITFVFSDFGFYFGRNFNYRVQINNSPDFSNGASVIESPVLNAVDGIVRWESGNLIQGEYFWRAIVYDAADTNASPVNIFTITDEEGFGYLAQKKQLQLFSTNNINYSEQLNSLVLNTNIKPPHPEQKFFLDSISISVSTDTIKPSTFTTDGTYFYLAQLPVYIGGAKSKIYKIGTGENGTIAGENYGEIPGISVYIFGSMAYHDGYLYVCTAQQGSLLRINPENGDTLKITVPGGLLFTPEKSSQRSGCYLYSDGEYMYNLAAGTTQYPDKFVLRTFDPGNNWSKTGEDIIFNGTTIPNVMSFFIVDGYAIMYENFIHAYLRRYRLADRVFEEEWVYSIPAKDYFTVTYDHINNFVYFLIFRPGNTPYTPGFTKYRGTYVQADGEIVTQNIGPASKWNDVEFEIDRTNSNGIFKTYLWGRRISSGIWELLDTLDQQYGTLSHIDAGIYSYLRLNFNFVDSSAGISEPLKFNSLKVNYDYLPEISMIPQDFTIEPDSMLQGIDIHLSLKARNFGYLPVDSLKLDFYLNEGDDVFFTKYISVKVDSFSVINQVIKTDSIVFENKIKAIATAPLQEYFYYNNLIEKNFYVARDSVRPSFRITFDGKEIMDGDIVSSKPEVVITLTDDGPRPLDESLFTIVFDNSPLTFTPDTLEFSYIPYPNSEATIKWTPAITEDGRHTLEVLAKDASGNFFDTTSYRINFNVFNESDIKEVYNFPNPFRDDTYFTFIITGAEIPEELKIRIYTIAGRLIRSIDIPRSALGQDVGFKRIHWDGRDQDGDEIANGLYFYKMIYKNGDVVKTVTQKLAKIR